MDWLHLLLAGLCLALAAMSWHYRDHWRAAEGRVAYWETRYEREREKYRKLVGSLVSQRRAKEPTT